MFGRNGRLQVDLMFDINTNNGIKNKSHLDYVQNLQNAVIEVYSKIHQNNEVLQTNSKQITTKNIRCHIDLWKKSCNEEGQGNLEVTGKITFMK